MTSLQTHALISTIGLVELQYVFKDRTKVLRVLHSCSFLAPLLLDAYIEILTYFPYSRSCLEIDTDPEGNGKYKLLVTIIADLEPDDAFKTLQDFDNNWWLFNLDRAQGYLNICLELQ